VGGALGAAPTRAAETAAAEPIPSADYSIYIGGFHASDITISIGLQPNSYHVVTQMRSAGFLGWVSPWRSEAMSEGLMMGAGITPTRYQTLGEYKGRPRGVTIDYVGGAIGHVQVNPPAREDEDRPEIPAAELEGSLDPSSALLAVARRVTMGEGCAGREKVFDGRRRYDIVVTQGPVETLRANDYNVFSGPAVRCDFTYIPVAGWTSSFTRSNTQGATRSGKAWFGEIIPGRLSAPVRIELSSEIGAVLLHARRLPKPNERDAAR
jgi:hypothetical protein